MVFALFLAFASLLVVDASPLGRDITPPVLSCSNATVLTDLPYGFTLAAVYLNGPNDNSTGVPLVLGEQGATDGEEFHIVDTYATYPYDDYPWLTLSDSGLKAYNSDGTTGTNATSIFNGTSINFISTADYPPWDIYPDPAFVAVSCPGNPYPILSAVGQTDQWSLCPQQLWTSLTYNASITNNEYNTYNTSACIPVAVNIVPYYTLLESE